MNGLVRRRTMGAIVKEELVHSKVFADNEFKHINLLAFVEKGDKGFNIFTTDEHGLTSSTLLIEVPKNESLGTVGTFYNNNYWNVIDNVQLEATSGTSTRQDLIDNTSLRVPVSYSFNVPLTDTVGNYRLDVDGFVDTSWYSPRLMIGSNVDLKPSGSFKLENDIYKAKVSVWFDVVKQSRKAVYNIYKREQRIHKIVGGSYTTTIEYQVADTPSRQTETINAANDFTTITIQRVFGDCTINLYKLN